MKINILYLVSVSLLFSCSSGCTPVEYQENSSYLELNRHKGIELNKDEFQILIDIVNKDTDFPASIPDSLSNKILILDENENLKGKQIIKYDNLHLGVFFVLGNTEKELLIVTFSNEGKLNDYRLVNMSRKEDNKWSIFYSDWNFTENNCIEIKFVDTTQSVKHPSLAKTIQKDVFKLDTSGMLLKIDE